MESLSRVFDMLQYFETILPLVERLWSSWQDCRYISWVLALLEACDVTNNGLHLGCHLGFYQELEIRLKPREIVIFVMAWFYFWKKLKKHVLSPKIGVTNCTFDVISRNHSTWPSLNLSQNLREGWTNSYWKPQALMFYPLRKNWVFKECRTRAADNTRLIAPTNCSIC